MDNEKRLELMKDILQLKYVEKKPKLDIVNSLSEKYQLNPTTIYRNIELTDKTIKQNIELLRVLTDVELDKRVFKDAFEKIKKEYSL